MTSRYNILEKEVAMHPCLLGFANDHHSSAVTSSWPMAPTRWSLCWYRALSFTLLKWQTSFWPEGLLSKGVSNVDLICKMLLKVAEGWQRYEQHQTGDARRLPIRGGTSSQSEREEAKAKNHWENTELYQTTRNICTKIDFPQYIQAEHPPKAVINDPNHQSQNKLILRYGGKWLLTQLQD